MPGSRGCAYKTASGRHEWLNQDPIGVLGGLNLYAFLYNQPISWIDPFGYDSVVVVSANTVSGDSIAWTIFQNGKVYKNISSNKQLISTLEAHTLKSHETIDTLNLSGHGYGAGISYGGEKRGFHVQTLTDEDVLRLRPLFSKNAEIKLWSCQSASQPEQMQALADKLQVKVTGKTENVAAGPDVDFVIQPLADYFTEVMTGEKVGPAWQTVSPNPVTQQSGSPTVITLPQTKKK